MPTSECIALSTQSVGVGPGRCHAPIYRYFPSLTFPPLLPALKQAGSTSMLARVAIVDYQGVTLLDCFVKPTLPVSDYRTSVTGILPQHLESSYALAFDVAQQSVALIIANKIIVGHSLWNDFSVLGLPHPAVDTRDFALYRPFRKTLRASNIIGLPTIMWHFMKREVQKEHVVPLENVRAAVDLYRSVEIDCEASVAAGDWPFHLPPGNFARCYL